MAIRITQRYSNLANHARYTHLSHPAPASQTFVGGKEGANYISAQNALVCVYHNYTPDYVAKPARGTETGIKTCVLRGLMTPMHMPPYNYICCIPLYLIGNIA